MPLLQRPNLLHQLLLYLQPLYLLPLLKYLLQLLLLLIQPLVHQFLKRAVERKTMQTLWYENRRDKEIKRVVKKRKTFYEKNNYCSPCACLASVGCIV